VEEKKKETFRGTDFNLVSGRCCANKIQLIIWKESLSIFSYTKNVVPEVRFLLIILVYF
jgi:hypothetical protein